jgi:non-ribosomal peptide synthetase component F
VKLEHLYALTDHNAVLQHANFSLPNKREGYTVDDNARALVFATKAQKLWPNNNLAEFQQTMASSTT